MSHFSVLVIGENIEEQLGPYHEFECTGYNDQYVQEVDVTEECKEKGLDWHGLERKIVKRQEDVDINDKHKYGYAIVDENTGEILKAVNRTNPNSKWDWYVVGGRWKDFLRLKNGRMADKAKLEDIDLSGMRKEAAEKAGNKWDRAHAAKLAAGGNPDDKWMTWEHVREVECSNNIDAARNMYNSQTLMRAVSDALNEGPFADTDIYLLSRDEFVSAAENKAISTYAVVKNGEWIAKGSMGWFGCSTDEQKQEDWNKYINNLLDSLPGDTLITVVDCHI